MDIEDSKTIISELPETSTFYSSRDLSENLSISNSVISVESDFWFYKEKHKFYINWEIITLEINMAYLKKQFKIFCASTGT